MQKITFTDIDDIKVGHAHNLDAGMGCTVVICEKGATAGIDVRGGAPGTRESDLLNPINLVEKIHAVLLAGGSAFGLDAVSGVMQPLGLALAGPLSDTVGIGVWFLVSGGLSLLLGVAGLSVRRIVCLEDGQELGVRRR